MIILGASAVNAQVQVPLDEIGFFKSPGKTWGIVGEVSALPEEPNSLTSSKGKGILINLPTKRNSGEDLYTLSEYGDMDLELEYMMAPGSNSGIYIQGRYEIQLLDSWGVTNPRAGDNGGIYERWDDTRPEGKKGFEGYAPRQNVSRAPGLWQHLSVSFRAPRFDDSGNKIENAKILRTELNGVVIHENVELFGPTRGGMENNEKARGPLRIQGDHGAVAFRNINITNYDKPAPELTGLAYSIYEGRFDQLPDFNQLTPESQGSIDVLTSKLNPRSKQYLIRYTGVIDVKEAGDYSFSLNTAGGNGVLRVNNESIVEMGQNNRRGNINLEVGEVPIELIYAKYMDWVEPGLGLEISGVGLRPYQLSASSPVQRSGTDPILVDARDTPLLRSFMDLPNHPRVTHAVSVGSGVNVHYTYDMDHGSLFQIWRGGFLNATPMWNSRGDGSSRPLGSVVYLGSPVIPVALLSAKDDIWPVDTAGTSYRPRGYKINNQNEVTFSYEAYGATVSDEVIALENGRGVKREIHVQDIPAGLHFLLAKGSSIEEISKGMYAIDDKTYYLKLEGETPVKPFIRESNGGEELIVPAPEKLVYTLLF